MTSTLSLSAFQDAFAAALAREDVAATIGLPDVVAALVAQPAFAVYRNTVRRGAIDAVQASYPALLPLVGEEWLRAAAALYVQQQPPTEPSLLRYGRGFADFLDRFEPVTAEMPYLGDVARIDVLWSDCHLAADAPVLEASALAACPGTQLLDCRLKLHPAARWRWFADVPAYTLWRRHRFEADHSAGDELDWQGEGVLLTRPEGAVQSLPLDAAGCAFLTACADGAPLACAAADALEADPGWNLPASLSAWLAAGAFCALERRAGAVVSTTLLEIPT
ncbi:DNA-binding domain-containing protein [Caldimonas brevitalea]|uniref:Glutamate synthase [NADPH] large chain n=1 Tax=Caldimonas brevitalea TaxID=413882 RepID=A0A0G3BS24_9BURK|nr:DNA-binding domain-containing protein [Caldimonas brevitalea]AKJ30206.1 glutamate synthase [NADPH] large chain [Caldimonas brevitalea]